MQNCHRLYIKGMVCGRCILLVQKELEVLGTNVHNITLGEACIHGDDILLLLPEISRRLELLGLQLMEGKSESVVRKVEDIVATFYNGSYDFPQNFRYTKEIESLIGISYDKISAVYYLNTGVTIEEYIIQYKVNRVKEMLANTENSLSSIAYMLGYSSVAHVSGQFKTVTGSTPTVYKMNLQHNAES